MTSLFFSEADQGNEEDDADEGAGTCSMCKSPPVAFPPRVCSRLNNSGGKHIMPRSVVRPAEWQPFLPSSTALNVVTWLNLSMGAAAATSDSTP